MGNAETWPGQDIGLDPGLHFSVPICPNRRWPCSPCLDGVGVKAALVLIMSMSSGCQSVASEKSLFKLADAESPPYVPLRLQMEHT